MNADTFNASYPVGTLVFAYPGARPEDIPSARRIVTRTSTEAKSVGLDRDGVVWVEGHGAYISLTHVDPVSESVWKAAKEAEETAAAVAAKPQPLSDQRLAEIREHVAATQNWSLGNLAARDLLAEVQRLKAYVARIESALCECQPEREHDDYRCAADYMHAAGCLVADIQGGAR